MVFITTRTAQGLKDKLRVIAKEKKVDFNSVMRAYMYERFIERLSKSKYRENIIIKGGFYLSTLFGVESRATIDIDASIRRIEFSDKIILKMIKEIISTNVNDNVKFSIDRSKPIREIDEYGGLRVHIIFNLENIRDSFHIDVVTGDSIYPGPISYKYNSIMGNEKYSVLSYNLETVLAEKMETLLSQLELTSRMKDYYDIYLIQHMKGEEIDKDKLIKAVGKTFRKRNFIGDMVYNFSIIKNSEMLRGSWERYARNNKYANGIKYDDVISSFEKLVEVVSPVAV